jgi:hypothetical protein
MGVEATDKYICRDILGTRPHLVLMSYLHASSYLALVPLRQGYGVASDILLAPFDSVLCFWSISCSLPEYAGPEAAAAFPTLQKVREQTSKNVNSKPRVVDGRGGAFAPWG